MKYNIIFLYLILLSTFFACKTNENEPPPIIKSEKSIHITDSNFVDFAKRNIEAILKINASEHYHFQIETAFINRDTLKDAVILVNREEHALDAAKRDGNLKFLKKMGYTGLHNHLFVFIGGSHNLLQTAPVGSNIRHPLKIHFETITKPSHTDFYVEYRNRNSMYRNYYTVRGDKIYLTLNCPVFDLIGEKEPKAFAIKHQKAKVRTSKDIVIYDGAIANYQPENIKDINSFYPDSIIPTDELDVYFIYDEKLNAYVTPMRPKE